MSTVQSIPIRLPQMGESLVEGTVVSWLKEVGDQVARDEDLLEIETEKTSVAIPAPASGVLAEIRVPAGETVPVGTIVAVIESASAPDLRGEGERLDDEPRPPRTSRPIVGRSAGGSTTTRDARSGVGFISPSVARIMREHGVPLEELRRIQGTGARGRVRRRDVEHYLQSRGVHTGVEEGRGQRVPMSQSRRTIAEKMVRSVRLAPHAGLFASVDMKRVVDWRRSVIEPFQAAHGFRITYTPIVVRCVASVLGEFPMVNVEVEGANILVKEDINIGVAVAADPYGLVVPVVRNADQLSLLETARTVNALAERARNHQLEPRDVESGSFTITNVGTFGVTTGFPIINYPEVAILCTGAIHEEVVPIDGVPEIRPTMSLSLVFDHRVIDGELGGRFLQAIVKALTAFEPPDLGIDRAN